MIFGGELKFNAMLQPMDAVIYLQRLQASSICGNIHSHTVICTYIESTCMADLPRH